MKVFAMLAAVCLLTALPVTAHAAANVAPDTTGTAAYDLGALKITAMQDTPGAMPLDIFTGAPEAAMKKLAPEGTVPAGVTVFLIQANGKNILVDTGNGPGKGALLSLLTKLGLTPNDIDAILLTHMHGDHVGGLQENGNPVYTKAKVYVSTPELLYWTQNAAPGQERTANMAKAVQKAYGANLVSFELGASVIPDITSVPLVGHTPGHTAFLVHSEKVAILFWGDIVHGAAIQFPLPEVCAQYDMDVPKAVNARKSAMQLAADKKIPVAGAHLPFPAIGRVARDGEAFTYLPGL
ncbi:MAG: Hydroxyacylglutathione hydrolase [Desulfovibrio sp.]